MIITPINMRQHIFYFMEGKNLSSGLVVFLGICETLICFYSVALGALQGRFDRVDHSSLVMDQNSHVNE